jgi:crossover junction endodeoxyribonuclease RuvC
MAIEKVFFSTNVKTAIRVGQAQGVMLLAAAHGRVPVAEYAPGTIKKQVTGSGRADKKMVIKTVQDIFGSKIQTGKWGKTHFDNAADALAIAMCHAFKERDRDLLVEI